MDGCGISAPDMMQWLAEQVMWVTHRPKEPIALELLTIDLSDADYQRIETFLGHNHATLATKSGLMLWDVPIVIRDAEMAVV